MREYRGGLADWVEAGEPTESVTDTGVTDAAPPDQDAAKGQKGLELIPKDNLLKEDQK